MTTLEKVQHFLRTNGIWDVSYADGSHLSDRLARFIDDELDAGLVDKPMTYLTWNLRWGASTHD